MAESTMDLAILTMERFKSSAERKIPQSWSQYFDNPQSLTTEQLMYFAQNCENDMDLLNYCMGLLMLKISQDSPFPNGQGLNYSEWMFSFLNICPQYGESIIECYSNALIQEILSAESQDLERWANVIQRIKEKNFRIEAPVTTLNIRFSAEGLNLLSKCVETKDKTNIQHSINHLLIGQQTGLQMNDLVNMSAGLICDAVITKNDMRNINAQLGEEVKRDYPEAKEIIGQIKLLQNTEEEVKEQIRFIEQEVGTVEIPKRGNLAPINNPLKQKQQKVLPNDSQLKPFPEYDLTTVKLEQQTLYARTSGNIHVSITRGSFPNGELMVVKAYTALGQLSDLEKVRDEIKFLTHLSNRATPENCFLKFYGSVTQNNSIYLYMEAHPYNLMDVITGWKNQNQVLPQEKKEEWICSLIRDFALINSFGIHHCDIKPHNIIVTSNLKLKIIDFSISKISTEMECTMNPTGQYPIQGTKGYMAPELEEMLGNNQQTGNFKPGKADVFSLGLTILQFHNYEDLTSLNMKAHNQQLLSKVQKLNAKDWVKNLLVGMLNVDPHKRLSFNKCLKYLPAAATTLNVSGPFK